MYQLVERLSDSVGHGNVIFNSPVVSIKQRLDNDEKYCTVITKDKEEYNCKFVIMAVPPHLIGTFDLILFISIFVDQIDLLLHSNV